MNKMKISIPFILLILTGCGGKSLTTQVEPTVPGPFIETGESIEKIYFCSVLLQLSGDSNRCMNSRSEAQQKQLQRTLLNYSKQSPWPFSLLETQSINRRYGLTIDEKKCIQQLYCFKGNL